MSLTQVQKNRLWKLYHFVRDRVQPKYFNMKFFRADIDKDSYYYSGDIKDVNQCTIKDKSCGTVGCLMGWTPFALPEQYKKYKLLPKQKNKDVDWNKASEKLFNLRSDKTFERWNYLFDADWAQLNGREVSPRNQKRSALRRIKNFIRSNGKITDSMRRHMDQYQIDHYN